MNEGVAVGARGTARGEDHRWTVAALGVIAVLAVVDVALGADVNFTGSLVIAPFLASAMVGPRTTALVTLATLVVAALLVLVNEVRAFEAVMRIVVVLGGGGLATWLAARRRRRERELATVTRVAEVAQRCVLTAVPARVGDLAFASRYLSASPVALIGGDFYEVVACENGAVRAVVGDVRGKGLDAVRLAAVVLGSFREAAQSLDDLEDIASLMDRRLRRHLDDEDFVTAVFGEFGTDGTLTLVNCGHHPPLLIRADGMDLLTPQTATTPLGLDPVPVAETALMLPGDRLLLYTDGLVEARSRSGRMIALDHLANTLRHPNLDQALAELVERLQAIVISALEDDLALVLAEYLGAGISQAPRVDRISSMTTE
jgi:hypothetical protein